VLVLFRLPAWWNDFIAGLVLLGVLVLDGRLRQALARHQRALKYGRFQPGNKGESTSPLSQTQKRGGVNEA
jgi:AI-2 transport system permease protein